MSTEYKTPLAIITFPMTTEDVSTRIGEAWYDLTGFPHEQKTIRNGEITLLRESHCPMSYGNACHLIEQCWLKEGHTFTIRAYKTGDDGIMYDVLLEATIILPQGKHTTHFVSRQSKNKLLAMLDCSATFEETI